MASKRPVHAALLEEGEHDDESLNRLGILWMKAHCAASHRTGYAVVGMAGRSTESDITAALVWLDWHCPAEHAP